MRYQTIQEFNNNTALTPIKALSRNPKLLIPSPILLLMLAACGGGGGGGARPVVTAPASLDPDLLSGLLAATTDENNQDFSHQLLPTAELEGEVTLSLAASGDDNDNEFFVIDDSGNLILSDDADASQVFDHETTPTRIVSVTATATDDSGESLTEDIVISINDIADENPVFTSSSNLQVYEGSTGLIAQIRAIPDIDGTTITYSIDDNGFFDINSNTGLLSVKQDAVLDYETNETHTVTVTATDGSNNALTAEQTITIRIKDVDGTPSNVNEDPVFAIDAPTSFNLAENVASTTFGAVTATDPEGGTISYSLNDDAPSGFAISDAGVISYNDNDDEGYDYETDPQSLSLTVTATDDAGNSATHNVTINITDVDEVAPVFASDAPTQFNLAENETSATFGAVTASDPGGGTVSYSLNDDAPTGFVINTSTGAIAFTGSAYDYEALTSADRAVPLTMTATDDAGNDATHNVTINITDVNEDPVFASDAPTAFNLAENVNLAIFGAVTATDPEGETVSYSLNDDAPTGFVINASTGAITFSETAYDYEALTAAERTITLTVTASDGTETATHEVDINITNINESRPDFSTAPDSFDLTENVTSATIGTVTAIFETPLSYSLDSTSMGLGFAIDASTGEISFDIANGTNLTAYNFETDPDDIDLIVTASDANNANNSATHTVTVTIRDAADVAPVFNGSTTATTNENNANFSHNLPFEADLEDGTVTLELASGGDNEFFTIDGNDNLVLKDTADASEVFDHETAPNNERTVTVTATDASNSSLFRDQDITISITDINEGPQFVLP